MVKNSPSLYPEIQPHQENQMQYLTITKYNILDIKKVANTYKKVLC